jgi:tRNA pseudouridine(55) synthase
MEKYVVLEKTIGETPLSCTEAFRNTRPDLVGIPLSYAGRLDPMASGKLIVLIGDECKHQTNYHGLDKEYEFSVLFGISSDTQDVLGRLQAEVDVVEIFAENFSAVAQGLVGEFTFTYPLFSAKTVKGKPLHMWTLEGRLDEIEIPTRTSTIYELELTRFESKPRQEIAATALQKINTIPKVTDPRKALGNDFRRDDVRADWQDIAADTSLPPTYTIATFRCIASSGAYMRTLATSIAEKLDTTGLAFHIHRTKIGHYNQVLGLWDQAF